MTMPKTRLRRVLDQARHVLETTPEPWRPGLGDHEISAMTRRTALVPGPTQTLVHSLGRRGLSALVDPSTTQTLECLVAVGRELRRCGVDELIRGIRADGAKRRGAQLLKDD